MRAEARSVEGAHPRGYEAIAEATTAVTGQGQITEADGWRARWHAEGRTIFVDELVDAAGDRVQIPTHLDLGTAADLMPLKLWEAVSAAWRRSTEPPCDSKAAEIAETVHRAVERQSKGPNEIRDQAPARR
ncbi:hypothetical protein ACFYTQ_17260 [Nocardia sp. NPDC004068]|uniref:hypothetical protein n=1 Tax=Nocardia sp. NPDC004068 TaxID=3364303 RepID=UPI003699E165